jgi:hypothetical protein
MILICVCVYIYIYRERERERESMAAFKRNYGARSWKDLLVIKINK